MNTGTYAAEDSSVVNTIDSLQSMLKEIELINREAAIENERIWEEIRASKGDTLPEKLPTDCYVFVNRKEFIRLKQSLGSVPNQLIMNDVVEDGKFLIVQDRPGLAKILGK